MVRYKRVSFRAWPNLKYMLVETCPFTHQAYIALTCNKGGRFRARYVLKAHAAELIKSQLLSQGCQEGLSCVLLAWVVPGRWHSVAPQLRGSCGSWAAARQGGEARVAKANRGSVDMKQFDSVRVVGQCRPGAPHPSCWSANGAGTVVVFAPAGVTNAARSNLLSGHQTFVLGVTRSSSSSPYNHAV